MHTTNQLTTSPRGIAFIVGNEGKKYRAYKDTAGKWTTGVGHLIQANEKHLIKSTLTEAQVMAMFDSDRKFAEDAVNYHVKTPLLQHQFDVLVGFVFHFGRGRFIASTLLRQINQNRHVLAADQLLRWNKERIPGSKKYRVNKGLAKRAQRRRIMYLGGTDEEVAQYA